jgi:hypothetical protein
LVWHFNNNRLPKPINFNLKALCGNLIEFYAIVLNSCFAPGKHIPSYHWRSCFFSFSRKAILRQLNFSLKSDLSRKNLSEIYSKFFHGIAPLKTPAKIAEVTKNHALGAQ